MVASLIRPVLPQNLLYICQGVDILPDGYQFRIFRPDTSIQYHPFCDDFGPMNMSSIINFVRKLQDEFELHSSCTLLYVVDESERCLTNALFLLGAYMIMQLGMSAEEVDECFDWVEPNIAPPHSDATSAPSDFDLTLMDCWQGLKRGIALGWVDMPSEEPGAKDFLWGAIDIDEYNHYDNPLNGDLHFVVPGKFVAFKGPRDLGEAVTYRDKKLRQQERLPGLLRNLLRRGAGRARRDGGGATQRAAVRQAAFRGQGDRGARPRVRGLHGAARRRGGGVPSRGGRGQRRYGGTLQGGAVADGDADRGVPDAATRLHGAGGDGVDADHAAGVRHRGAAALPLLARGGGGAPCADAAATACQLRRHGGAGAVRAAGGAGGGGDGAARSGSCEDGGAATGVLSRGGVAAASRAVRRRLNADAPGGGDGPGARECRHRALTLVEAECNGSHRGCAAPLFHSGAGREAVSEALHQHGGLASRTRPGRLRTTGLAVTGIAAAPGSPVPWQGCQRGQPGGSALVIAARGPGRRRLRRRIASGTRRPRAAPAFFGFLRRRPAPAGATEHNTTLNTVANRNAA